MAPPLKVFSLEACESSTVLESYRARFPWKVLFDKVTFSLSRIYIAPPAADQLSWKIEFCISTLLALSIWIAPPPSTCFNLKN
jgi:hypothetical protein